MAGIHAHPAVSHTTKPGTRAMTTIPICDYCGGKDVRPLTAKERCQHNPHKSGVLVTHWCAECEAPTNLAEVRE